MDSFTNVTAVTPSNSAALPGGPCKAVYVGGAGNLTLELRNGTTVLLTAAPVGWHYISANKVMATGTAATNILAAR